MINRDDEGVRSNSDYHQNQVERDSYSHVGNHYEPCHMHESFEGGQEAAYFVNYRRLMDESAFVNANSVKCHDDTLIARNLDNLIQNNGRNANMYVPAPNSTIDNNIGEIERVPNQNEEIRNYQAQDRSMIRRQPCDQIPDVTHSQQICHMTQQYGFKGIKNDNLIHPSIHWPMLGNFTGQQPYLPLPDYDYKSLKHNIVMLPPPTKS